MFPSITQILQTMTGTSPSDGGNYGQHPYHGRAHRSSMGVLAFDLATRSGWATNINRTSGVRISDVKRGDPWADPPQKLLNMRQPLSTSPTTE